MDNMIETAKENKMTIFGVIGAIAAVFLGKKVVEKRRGSGAYRFQLPMSGGKMPEEEAFFAFKQRDGRTNNVTINRMEWMNKYAEAGYNKPKHGKGGPGEAMWSEWSKDLLTDEDGGQWSQSSSEESKLFDGAFGSEFTDYEEGQWGGSESSDNFSSDFFPKVPKF